MKEITIGNRRIGSGDPPFIIAEMSGNHNQPLDRALELVKAVAKAGAHAFKIQTYTPETMTLNIQERDFMILNPTGFGRESLYLSSIRRRIPPGNGTEEYLMPAGN